MLRFAGISQNAPMMVVTNVLKMEGLASGRFTAVWTKLTVSRYFVATDYASELTVFAAGNPGNIPISRDNAARFQTISDRRTDNVQ
jgi:hypothetical protein